MQLILLTKMHCAYDIWLTMTANMTQFLKFLFLNVENRNL